MGREQAFRDAIASSRRLSLDTNACIFFLTSEPGFASLVELALEGGEQPTHISGIAYLELLVRPWRDGDELSRRQIAEFIKQATGGPPLGISAEELDAAAQIRATTRMKVPDSLVAASAAIHGCDVIVGNDWDFDKLNHVDTIRIARQGGRPVRLPRFVYLKEYAAAADAAT